MGTHYIKYDIIKIIAVVMVIYIHTTTDGFFLFSLYYEPNTSSSWLYWAYMIPSVISQIAVPLFFMVSGALFLGKEESIRSVWKHRISKYSVVLVLVSLLYYVLYSVRTGHSLDFFRFLQLVYSGSAAAHLWFLYSYLGYLIILPFLRYVAKGLSRNSVFYLLGISVVFSGIIPMLQFLLLNSKLQLNPDLRVGAFTGMAVFYPLLGYGFTKFKPNRKTAKVLLLIGVLSIIPVVLVTYLNMRSIGVYDYSSEHEVTVFWECFNDVRTVVVFVILSCLAGYIKKQSLTRLIKSLGSCVFGVYLFSLALQRSVFMISLFQGISACLSPFLSIVIFVILVFLITALFVYCLRKIPFINKYI